MEQFKLQKKINHIAFIMDGNGRWAKRRLMPRTYGHKVACKRIIEIVRFLRTLNVKVVSLYAFSTENWNRPKNDDYVFNICLNYGGRQEIVRAAKLAYQDIKEGKINEEDLTIDTFKNYLYTSGLPEIDLMIRTSGEERVSNFLLYQLAYSEFIFTKTCWPDFTPEKLVECLKEYEKRDRRFGAIKEEE